MTWRAFILGLVSVLGVSLLDPYTSFNKNWGWNTQGHFPVAAVFVLVVLTVGLNLLIGLFSRRAALKQPELMLIWCMCIVGFSVVTNPMRLGPPMMAAPAYLARRPDIPWRDTALEAAPEKLLLTKDTRSLAAEQFFESWHGEGRVPWRMWITPASRWGLFFFCYSLAVLFLCALLRRQWVERERLQFPLARIPLEFTAGSGEPRVLPNVFGDSAFVAGLIAAAGLRLIQGLPVIFGGTGPWAMTVPLKDVLAQTPLQYMYFENANISWTTIGLSYLLPGDVSLSIWFFYLFGRVECQIGSWMGSTLHYGGTYSTLMRWQRPGAYLAFTVGTLYMARRHLGDVLRAAVGRRLGVDDSREPVSFMVGFWGLILCCAACIVWFAVYGMKPWVAVLFFAFLMGMELIHARLVAQSGMFTTAPLSSGPRLIHALGFGHVWSRSGIVVAEMQYQFLTGANNSLLGPVAIHAYRIGDVLGRRRRWLLPALLAALVVATLGSGYTSIRQGYTDGGLIFANVWSMTGNPQGAFDSAHRIITQPYQVAEVQWHPLALGAVLTGIVMFMRARFYWWPIHPVGLLAFASYSLDRIWLSFLVGWLVKLTILKFGSGKVLRQGRVFFIGFILTDFFISSVSTIICMLSKGQIPRF